jgi:hypothetical protein
MAIRQELLKTVRRVQLAFLPTQRIGFIERYAFETVLGTIKSPEPAWVHSRTSIRVS